MEQLDYNLLFRWFVAGTPSATRRPLLLCEKFRPGWKPMTAGADKAYDTRDFVQALRHMKLVPRVAQNTTGRRTAFDRPTIQHSSYPIRLAKRY